MDKEASSTDVSAECCRKPFDYWRFPGTDVIICAALKMEVYLEWALWPIFYLRTVTMDQRSRQLGELIRPAVEALGLELLGVEYVSQGKHSVLRIYIDSDDGITVDDCQRVSHQVSGVLEVEDPIRGQYNLEVSSPGIDRLLFTAQQFERFVGERCTLRLREALSGQRKFTGVIAGVEDETITLDIGDKELIVDVSEIDKANLNPER